MLASSATRNLQAEVCRRRFLTGDGAVLRRAVGDGIVVADGEIPVPRQWTALGSAEEYEPVSVVWTRLPVLTAGIHGMPVAAHEGTAFVLGGSDRAGGNDKRGRVLILS